MCLNLIAIVIERGESVVLGNTVCVSVSPSRALVHSRLCVTLDLSVTLNKDRECLGFKT